MFLKDLLGQPFIAAVLILNLGLVFVVWVSEGAGAAFQYLFKSAAIFCLVFVAAYFVSLAIRIALSPKQRWDAIDHAWRKIKNGSYSREDEDIKTGLVFNMKTGEYETTARPADRLYRNILSGD